jgi:plasmid stabilization system protein ParE
MDSQFEVVVLRLAREDVETIFQWIHQRSTGGADRWYQAFREAACSLAQSPHRYGLAPEASLVTEPVRQCFFKTRAGRQYRILFFIGDEEVRILRVRGPGQPIIEREDLES